MPTDRLKAVVTLCLLSSLAMPCGALNLQLKPSAHLSVQRDDNVFRASGSAPADSPQRVGDTLTTYGVGATLKMRESLQALELRGEYDHVSYASLSDLDYDRYLIGAEANLAYASLLKLKLDASRERRQENFAYRDDAQQSFITVNQGVAELRYAATPTWAGIARAEHYATEFSRFESRESDLDENAGEAGVEYRRNNFSSFGLALRQAEGDYPNRVVSAGDGREKDYTQRSVVSRIGYSPSGISDLTARLAYTVRSHDDPAVPDFKGVTGQLGYIRKFSGVSQLRLEAYRDLYYVEDSNANYVENLGARASYDYRWSAKLAAVLGLEYYDSNFRGSPNLAVRGESRKDKVSSARVALDYRPFLRLSLRPEYRFEQRESNTALNRYDSNVFGVDLLYEFGDNTSLSPYATR